MMENENKFVYSQFKTLKDLGLYDGPLEESDDDCLCNTQSTLNDSTEYLCETQEPVGRRSSRRCEVNDSFHHQKRYSSPTRDAYDSDDGSVKSFPRHQGASYRSPRHSPTIDDDDKFNDQPYNSYNGRPIYLSDASDGISPPMSPVHSDQENPEEEDLYGPGEPISIAQSIHLMIGMEPSQIGINGLPVNWTDASLSKSHNLVELQSGNPEFNQICSNITKANVTVHSVERIENKRLLDKFKLEIEHMQSSRKCSEKDLNIVYLFHGTCAEKMDLAEEGLDHRLARRGHFGTNGIYFSDDPRKCMKYLKRTGLILMCRVLLGDVKTYPDGKQDTELKREPEKVGSKQRYDSVKGRVSKYAEYVIYTNARALPEYIVTIGTKPDVLRRPQPKKAPPHLVERTAPDPALDPDPMPLDQNQKKKLDDFLDFTHCQDRQRAQVILSDCNWNVDNAIGQFLDNYS
ncbi:uncharacterized protein [Antedon mediterranea]|uniref:uncharacterized protein isoform X2 n=1 Tax=Antedon mediterranea TaxID=105859 RepID=UPI003AF7A357